MAAFVPGRAFHFRRRHSQSALDAPRLSSDFADEVVLTDRAPLFARSPDRSSDDALDVCPCKPHREPAERLGINGGVYADFPCERGEVVTVDLAQRFRVGKRNIDDAVEP